MNNEIKQVKLSEMFPLIEEKLALGGKVTFYPKGTSMLPLIRQGKDRVTLKKQEEPLRKNDVVFYRREDKSFILHRLVKILSDGTYVMCGDNQTVFETGIKDNNVIGVMTGVYRGEKFVSADDFSYRLYVRTLPLRRLWRKSFLRRAINWGLRKCRIKK